MIKIHFYGERPVLDIPKDTDQVVEDLVVRAARIVGISPLARHLFGLRDSASRLWLALSKKISTLPERTAYQFRLRFRTPSLDRLKILDGAAFHYFFYQVRADFLASELPELIKRPEDGLGLVVTDVLLNLLTHPGKKVGDIDLKSFLPHKLNGMANRLNVKRNVEQLIENLHNREAGYVRECYLFKIEESQCGYGNEEYIVEQWEGQDSSTLRLIVDPFHSEQPGLRYASHPSRKPVWKQMCRIEDVVFVSMRGQDLTVEVSRRSGTPCYLKLNTIEHLHSFVGCLSGYYRLMCTWTFDLCRELSTPSLTFLRTNKCHGPVRSAFAARKLSDKGGGEAGVGLVRESSHHYDRYYLDVASGTQNKNDRFTIMKKEDRYYLENSEKPHDSLTALVRYLIKTEGVPSLTRLLPPSDYDDAQVLWLCAKFDTQVSQADNAGPRIISARHLTADRERIIRGRYSDFYQAQWTTQGNKEVAVKVSKLNTMGEMERFLALASDLSLVQCECLVTLHGACLSPPALVMEYLPLGPLNIYLTNNKATIKEVELVEAGTYLARALWYLNQEAIHHNNIRCHNILVAQHTDQTFKVKLADPGVVRYDQRDLHWIPREHHCDPSRALRDPTTDTWAFATTLWQIFSYGAFPLLGADMEEVRSLYATGHLLTRPDCCPHDLYKVMTQCWQTDPQARRQPQAIMRDVNQILYQVFNSRKTHAYSTINPPADNPQQVEVEDDGLDEADDENASVTTQQTTITYSDGSTAQVTMNQFENNLVDDLLCLAINPPNLHYNRGGGGGIVGGGGNIGGGTIGGGNITLPPLISAPHHPAIVPTGLQTIAIRSTLAELVSVEDVNRLVNHRPSPPTQPLQLDMNDIQFKMKIGEGNYGQVYRGIMRTQHGQQQDVAIKTFKAVGQTDDLIREVDIMKKLHHKNIVRLLGLVDSDGENMYMVMEYLPMGSLQEYLKLRTDHIKVPALLKFALDIAEGMDYLEQCRVIHRDLAARNVLVAAEHTVKISDFGLAQMPNKGNYYMWQTYRSLPLAWYALECIEFGKYSHRSDVWSYGVTCWEMFTHGKWPYLPSKQETLIQYLKNGNRLTLQEPCPHGVYNKLLRPCWDIEPQARPDFSTLITIVKELQEEYL